MNCVVTLQVLSLGDACTQWCPWQNFAFRHFIDARGVLEAPSAAFTRYYGKSCAFSATCHGVTVFVEFGSA